jgi:hypothetical protein
MTSFAEVEVCNDQSILFFPEKTALRRNPEVIIIYDMWDGVLHSSKYSYSSCC